MPQQTYSREEVLAALAIQPCHVFGEHDPTHTPRHFCDLQRSAALERLLQLLEVSEGDLPRRVHSQCPFCGDDPELDRWVKVGPYRCWPTESLRAEVAALVKADLLPMAAEIRRELALRGEDFS